MNIRLRNQLEEFEEMRHNAFITALELKSSGKHIAGIYGVNVPREILWALDIVPINIFGIDGSNIEAAEGYMDKQGCSLVKASYGYIVTDRCPFSHFADIIIGTGYCHEKKRMIQRLDGLKQVYILNENTSENSTISEYKDLVYFLQQRFNVMLCEDRLKDIVKKNNTVVRLIQEITDIYIEHPYIMGSDDLISIVYGSQFIFDLDERINKLYQLKEILMRLLAESSVNFSARRILITGAPVAGFKDEVVKQLSSPDMAILSQSYCEGENCNTINEECDLYLGLAQKYLAEGRTSHLDRIIKKYNIEVIVHMTFKRCCLMDREYENTNIPCLHITADYNDDYENIVMRIKEFLKEQVLI